MGKILVKSKWNVQGGAMVVLPSDQRNVDLGNRICGRPTEPRPVRL